MEIDAQRNRTLNFIVLLVLLAVIVAGLATLIYLTRDAIGGTDDPLMEKVLARLAWISLALMGLTLVLLLLAVMHFVRSRFPRRPHEPTPYVDAWSLAGKRLKLEDQPPEEEDRDDKAEE